MSGKAKRAKKLAVIDDLFQKFTEFNQIILVSLEHVSSRQIQDIRKLLRQNPENKGTLVVGKNTLTRKAIQIRMQEPQEGDESYEHRMKYWEPRPQLEKLLPLIKDRVAMIFTHESVSTLKPKIEGFTVPCRAKVGQIAPKDVKIPAGPTGIDPSDIKFFHALKVATKIFRGQIEITTAKDVIQEGQVVDASTAALLEKLNITPFAYGMKVLNVYDDGVILDPEFVSLTPEDYAMKFQGALKNVQALSMMTSYHTQASVASNLIGGFKRLLAMNLQLGLKNEKMEALMTASANANANAQANVTAEETAPVEEEKKEEKVDMAGAMNMFGGDDSSSDDDSDSSSDDDS